MGKETQLEIQTA